MFKELKQAIADAPKTWLPALFTTVVRQCIIHNVYKPGGMLAVIGRQDAMLVKKRAAGDDVQKPALHICPYNINTQCEMLLPCAGCDDFPADIQYQQGM